jgi:hypothetical protein
MFPTIAALYPALATSLVQYRVDRLQPALDRARAVNASGAKWPWESGLIGYGVSLSSGNDQHEVDMKCITSRYLQGMQLIVSIALGARGWGYCHGISSLPSHESQRHLAL